MINIERTTDTGYVEQEYELQEALAELNKELENNRTIWIDGTFFEGDIVTEDDLSKCKKNVCVTNKLIGG